MISSVILTASVTFPGHEVVYFLGRKILWTLKSNLVLFFGMSFIALYIIYRRGKWSEMPMDKNGWLSVTFPDCFVSSVLGTVSVVTILSYNFSTGEKQRGSLFKSFVEQHIKMSHQEVFFVYSFQLSDIFNLELRILQAGGRMFNGKIFFWFFWCRAADFHHNFIFIQFFPFQIPTCSLYFAHSNNASMRFPFLDEGCYCCSSIFCSHFPIYRFRIHDSWHVLVLFRIFSRMIFFFTSLPKG